ncbi:MAG: hypothetical protein M1837_004323 [Sclerophora amabilis]|nr:MAG: hypothetical protein M1837_004323 [Sclerophora amabilis]
MTSQPPPPPQPPPHGSSASSGLPRQGKYDIFVIPPHAAGGGFLYLPSFQTHRNSFLLGVACTTLFWLVGQIVAPVVKNWVETMVMTGGSGVLMLMMGIGVAGWAWGKAQAEGPASGWGHGGGGSENERSTGNASQGASQDTGPVPNAGGAGAAPKPTWQRANTGPAGFGNSAEGTARGAWERAREETRKKEDERKKKEEEAKKAKDAMWERTKAREKEAKEREEREKRAAEGRDRKEKQRERATGKPGGPTAGTGNKSNPPSPGKHQQPTARTYLGTEDEEYSFRPYDKPKKPLRKEHSHSSIYSESSYAPSHSTSRTTPPPSHRGAYTTKDPDKIVIKAVYSFGSAFTKVPTAQLVSGAGSVTDGLILRITTEGLFIDDDVRGVPQREWDVKAWTMKLVEVWCPHLQACGASSGSYASAAAQSHARKPSRFLFTEKQRAPPLPTSEESNALLQSFLSSCKANCTLGQECLPNQDQPPQSGDFKGLHVLRATIRDQEGRRYVFVLQDTEGWKAAVGLQRLRRSTQVRALGVSGMSTAETRTVLEALGWG